MTDATSETEMQRLRRLKSLELWAATAAVVFIVWVLSVLLPLFARPRGASDLFTAIIITTFHVVPLAYLLWYILNHLRGEYV